MSERTLIRRFKKATGFTPLQYLQEQRLFAAKSQLENAQYSFEQITWKVGYGDVNTFRQLFKKRIGMSPTITLPNSYAAQKITTTFFGLIFLPGWDSTNFFL